MGTDPTQVKKEGESLARTIRANATVRPRIVKRSGRDWLIVPVVMVVEGVLNGEYVPADELSVYVESWNGIPATLGHPAGPLGLPVSANSPEFEDRITVGRVFNTRFEDGRLKAEIWIDRQRAESMGEDARRALSRFMAGEGVEVSTGYFRDVEEKSGVFDGESYETISRNIRPDHLAILLDAEGACNWGDGCGAPRLNARASRVRLSGETSSESLAGVTTSTSSSSFVVGAINQGDLNMTNEEVLAVNEELEDEVVEVEETDVEVEETDVEIEETEDEVVEPAGTPEMEGIEELRELARAVREVGGVRVLVDLVRTHRADANRERSAIVARIAANQSNAFSREELARFDLATLRKLDASLRPVDFSGMGGTFRSNGRGDDDNSPPALSFN